MDGARLEDTFYRTHISSDMLTLLNYGVKLGPTERDLFTVTGN